MHSEESSEIIHLYYISIYIIANDGITLFIFRQLCLYLYTKYTFSYIEDVRKSWKDVSLVMIFQGLVSCTSTHVLVSCATAKKKVIVPRILWKYYAISRTVICQEKCHLCYFSTVDDWNMNPRRVTYSTHIKKFWLAFIKLGNGKIRKFMLGRRKKGNQSINQNIFSTPTQLVYWNYRL